MLIQAISICVRVLLFAENAARKCLQEKINTLESGKNDFEYAIDNLHEIESVSYSDYSNLINRFYELKEDNLRFRTFVQDYITSITVYRDKVVFCLNYGLGILDDVTKKYTFERKLFKTPTQKM